MTCTNSPAFPLLRLDQAISQWSDQDDLSSNSYASTLKMEQLSPDENWAKLLSERNANKWADKVFIVSVDCFTHAPSKRLYSSVNIVIDYGIKDRGSINGRNRNPSHPHIEISGSGAHFTSHPMYERLMPGSVLPLPPYLLVACAELGIGTTFPLDPYESDKVCRSSSSSASCMQSEDTLSEFRPWHRQWLKLYRCFP
jgi:hypothetical protein